MAACSAGAFPYEPNEEQRSPQEGIATSSALQVGAAMAARGFLGKPLLSWA